MNPIVVLGTRDDVASVLARHAPGGVERIGDVDEVLALGGDVDVIVVADGDGDGVGAAARVHRAVPAVPVIIVVPADDVPDARNRLMLTPGVGPDTTVVADRPIERLVEAVGDGAERGRRGRRHRTVLASMSETMRSWSTAPTSRAELLDRLVELAPVGVIVLDRDGRVLAQNRAAGSILGPLAIGTSFAGRFGPEEAAIAEHVAEAKTEPFAVELATAEGSRWLEVRASEIQDARGRQTLVVIEDVTERVAAERERERVDQELRFRRTLLEAQDEASPDGILVVAPDGSILSYNERFVEMWRIPPDVVRRRSDAEAIDAVLELLVDPDAFVRRVEALYRRPDDVSRDEIHLRDGRIFDRYSAPVRDTDGTHHGRVWFFRDVTERRREEANLRLLADAGRTFAAILDRDEILRRLARAAVPVLADWCVVYTITDGTIRRVAVEHADPADAWFLRELETHELVPGAERGVPLVIREAEPEFEPIVDPGSLVQDVRDAERLAAAVTRLGLHSWMCVPMIARERSLGAVSFMSRSRTFSRNDLSVAEQLARDAALAIDNADLLASERSARRAAIETANQLANLQRVTGQLTRALMPTEVAAVVAEAAVAGTSASVALVRAVDEDGDLRPLGAAPEGGLPALVGAGAPETEAIATAELVVMRSATIAGRWDISLPADVEVIASVPLVIDRRPIGVLTLGFGDVSLTDRDRAFLITLARQCAQALERADVYEREHHIAELLQRSLLPDRVVDRGGVRVAVRYQPAARGTHVGGDWYDVIELDGDRIGIAIGDTVGHGIRAAATMGQLRNALRAYALDETSPVAVLQRIERFITASGDDTMATLLYLVVDLRTREMRCASAGHPPPLVLESDGSARYAPVDPSVPLGTGYVIAAKEMRMLLEEGSALVLFTDGLIERREESLDVGLERLRLLGEETPRPVDPQRLADRLLSELIGGSAADDDVALAVLSFVDAPVRLELHLPAVVGSLRDARLELERYLERHGVSPDDVAAITTGAAEAFANAVEHAYGLGGGSFEVVATREDDAVVVEVIDQGRWRGGATPGRGYGLMMMEGLTDEVQIDRRESGTRVRLMRRLHDAAEVQA